MPQLCIREDESTEDEIGKKGDDADGQDDQANPGVELERDKTDVTRSGNEKKDQKPVSQHSPPKDNSCR